MSLKDLLKPVKFVDEQILRQYTKLTKKWEDIGKSRYSLTAMLGSANIAIILGDIIFSEIMGKPEPNFPVNSIDDLVLYVFAVSIATSYVGLQIHDIIHSIYNIIKPTKEYASGEIAEDKFEYLSRKIQKISRLPVLGFGLFALYRLGESILQKGINGDDRSHAALILGSTFVSLASSMYIKDSNPKILDKQPFWKTAYEKIKEKINVSTQPVPQPVPIQSSTLEDYI